jgi:hypothetical protein
MTTCRPVSSFTTDNKPLCTAVISVVVAGVIDADVAEAADVETSAALPQAAKISDVLASPAFRNAPRCPLARVRRRILYHSFARSAGRASLSRLEMIP